MSYEQILAMLELYKHDGFNNEKVLADLKGFIQEERRRYEDAKHELTIYRTALANKCGDIDEIEDAYTNAEQYLMTNYEGDVDVEVVNLPYIKYQPHNLDYPIKTEVAPVCEQLTAMSKEDIARLLSWCPHLDVMEETDWLLAAGWLIEHFRKNVKEISED